MKRLFVLFTIVLISQTLFAQKSVEESETINNHNFEVMLGAAGGTDDTFWLSARAVFSDRMSKSLRIGAGVEYYRIGMDTYSSFPHPGEKVKEKSFFASMADGFSLFVDFRVVSSLGKAVSFVGVIDAGMYAAGDIYDAFGLQIGLQPGFRFRLNRQGGLALNVRPTYKYMSGEGANVIGLLVGLSF